ncbi:hypothetical protein N0V88_006924 [Collariella sp. IMI 366227]|nr:hypothetical protein N0V88_006924 [Collariella sp. IMI 366227]
MSFAPQFQPPGGFNFDTSASPGQPLHANIFRPPPSPSSSSYNLGKSTGSLFSDISMSNAQPVGTAKRKRTNARDSVPFSWRMPLESPDVLEEEKSREFRYTLAGQISTTPAGPPAVAGNGMLDDSVYSDVDYRRALGPRELFGEDSLAAPSPGGNAAGPETSAGWSFFSLQTIGNVVGKVWEFCRNGGFRGFQAGGGQGYNVNGSTVTETTGKPWPTESPQIETPFYTPEDTMMNQEPPAYFPQPVPQPSPFLPVAQDINTPEPTPRPAAKRRQVSANTNDELKNWVVVDEPSSEQPKRFASAAKPVAPRPSLLARPRSGYYSQTSASSHRRISAPSQRFTGGTPTFSRSTGTRSLQRLSHAASPALTPREPASFASPRSSPVYVTTPSRIPIAVQPSPTQPQHHHQHYHNPPPPHLPSKLSFNNIRPSSSSSANHNHRRNKSSTSATTRARRPSTLENINAATSPRLDAEARQLAQRKLAADRDADARVDAFNARLLSMIRQGREALGTRVEVGDGGGGGEVGEGWG